MSLISALEVFSCFFMTGLIWVIQLVHYPSFSFVKNNLSVEFNQFHQFKITFIVMPVMLIELVCAIAWYIDSSYNVLLLVNLGLLALIWLSTFLLSVPIHARLTSDFSQELIDKLIKTNWPRTVLWSIRSLILIYILISQI